jgi:hypothetical protein
VGVGGAKWIPPFVLLETVFQQSVMGRVENCGMTIGDVANLNKVLSGSDLFIAFPMLFLTS